MEIGSVLELDNWELYGFSDQKKPFWLPFMKNNSLYRTVFYQSGRNAIEALLCLLQTKGIHKVLLPDYMCDTVKEAGERAGITEEFYRINSAFDFDAGEIEQKLDENTCLFVAHYFGKKTEAAVLRKIAEWKQQGTIIIEDVTMSFFSADNEGGVGFGTYTLGSIRKWLPVPDGGFISSREAELPQEIQDNAISRYTDFYLMVQAMKREYIQGGCVDADLKKIYMDYYSFAIRELFSDYRLYPMSEWTRNYLQNYDMDAVIKRRCENYDYLYARIQKISGVKAVVQRKEGYLPFGMVVYTEERDALLQYLIQNNIYCNVHWRLPFVEGNPRNLLTIPCDQRYGRDEMEYIADMLEKWGVE